VLHLVDAPCAGCADISSRRRVDKQRSEVANVVLLDLRIITFIEALEHH
jgi:hypothetical protein